MKKLFLLTVALFSASICFGQTTNINLNRQNNSSTDEQEIKRIILERRDAAPRVDKKALLTWHEKYMDLDYIRVKCSIIEPGSEMVSRLRKTLSQPSQLEYYSQTYDELEVRIYGDTAIATYKITSTGKVKSNPEPIRDAFRDSSTFTKRNGQ